MHDVVLLIFLVIIFINNLFLFEIALLTMYYYNFKSYTLKEHNVHRFSQAIISSYRIKKACIFFKDTNFFKLLFPLISYSPHSRNIFSIFIIFFQFIPYFLYMFSNCCRVSFCIIAPYFFIYLLF